MRIQLINSLPPAPGVKPTRRERWSWTEGMKGISIPAVCPHGRTRLPPRSAAVYGLGDPCEGRAEPAERVSLPCLPQGAPLLRASPVAVPDTHREQSLPTASRGSHKPWPKGRSRGTRPEAMCLQTEREGGRAVPGVLIPSSQTLLSP